MVRCEPIGFLQGFWVIFHRIRDALFREQHMGMVRGELQGVPIPGHQQRV